MMSARRALWSCFSMSAMKCSAAFKDELEVSSNDRSLLPPGFPDFLIVLRKPRPAHHREGEFFTIFNAWLVERINVVELPGIGGEVLRKHDQVTQRFLVNLLNSYCRIRAPGFSECNLSGSLFRPE